MLIYLTRRRREERVIALGRVVLVGLSALALTAPFAVSERPSPGVIELLYVYVAWAVVYLVSVWSVRRLPLWLRPATHALDLGYFAVLAFARQGTASPLFVVVLFALVTATVRWQWRGVVWTGAISLSIYAAAGAWAVWIVRDPEFEALRFVLRVICLAVLTLVLGLLGRRYQASQADIVRLSRWPRSTPEKVSELLEEVLPHAAETLRSRRIFFLWREDGRAQGRLAEWREGGTVQTSDVAAAVPSAWFGAEFDGKVFLWSGKDGVGTALVERDDELCQVDGVSLPAELGKDREVDHAIVLPITASALTGLLIAATDKPPSPDRLGFARLVAQHLAAQVDQVSLHRKRRSSALDQERTRMARDVHDGVAQSLAVAGLRLHAVAAALESQPDRARVLLAESEALLCDGQAELRGLTDGLRGTHAESSLASRAQGIARHLESGYGVAVRLEFSPAEGRLSPELVREAAQLIREAATNAARHAGARGIKISFEASDSCLRLQVEDDGHGLAFTGRRELAELVANDEGPRAIRERVRDLGGSLTIDSSPAGTVLDISLPLEEGDL